MNGALLRLSVVVAVVSAGASSACSRSGESTKPGTPSEPSASVAAPASAAASASPSAASSHRPGEIGVAVGEPVPSGYAVLLGPPAGSGSAGSLGSFGNGGGDIAKLLGATQDIEGKNFRLTQSASACHPNTECTGSLRLTVKGGYHVNKEYPYKLTMEPTQGITFLGRTEANVFSRAAGDFVEGDETHAKMTFRFRAAAAGPVRIKGVYKLSVCSAQDCEVQAQPVEVAVDVR